MMAKVPNLAECQPRFVAYCEANGLHEGDEWQTWEYMAWISKKAAEFRKLHGLSRWDSFNKLGADGHKQFTRFLETGAESEAGI